MTSPRPTSCLEAELLKKYRELGHAPPAWAYPLAPTIPFVGTNYGRWGGILVYASAENLSNYERSPETVPPFLQDERRFNRHRGALEAQSCQAFFPNVHMAPFNNGSLLVAIAYVAWRRFNAEFEVPSDLLESIAAANLCKFSIRVGESGKNRDYLGQPRMSNSIPYLQADLATLRPKLVLVPHAALRDITIAEVFGHGSCEILPIYQFNAGVVNRVLRKHDNAAKQLQSSLAGTHLARWVDKLTGYSPGYAYRYLFQLEIALKGK